MTLYRRGPVAGRAECAAALAGWLVAAAGPGASHGWGAAHGPGAARQPASPPPLSPLPAPVLRSVPVGRDPVALAVDQRTGRVFVVGAAGSVTTLDATTGAPLRSVAVGRGAQAVAVDEATGRAFVTDPGRLFMLDARTGAVLRAFPLNGGIQSQSSPAVDETHGEVFVATHGAPGSNPVGPAHPPNISVLDATTGQLRRAIPVGTDLLAVDGSARRLILPYSCGDTPGVADLCVDTLDATTGRRIKTADLSSQQGYEQQPSAVAVDARAGSAVVLYGDGRGDANIGVVATRTGAPRTPVVGAGGSFGLIAVDERVGRVAVVTTPDNYALATGSPPSPAASVSVVNARNGDVVGGDSIPNIPCGEASPVGVAADMNGTYFYVAATPSPFATARSSHTILDVLDARTGKLLRRVTLPYAAIPLSGVESVAMAVDGRTGRLFIANGSNNTVSMLDTARL